MVSLPQIPAAIILLVSGLLICFLGYRLFQWVLGLAGFVGGAFLASLFTGAMETWVATLVIIGCGLAGVVLSRLVYVAVVALLGAGLGVMTLSLFGNPSGGDAELWVVVTVCLAGAIAAVILQRYIIIVGTSFGGAWMAAIGALALAGDPEAMAAVGGALSRMYPITPATGPTPFAIGWLGLAAVTVLIQLRASSRSRRSATR